MCFLKFLTLHWRNTISVKDGEITRRTRSTTFILQASDRRLLFPPNFPNGDSASDNTPQHLIKGCSSYFHRLLWCVQYFSMINLIIWNQTPFGTNVFRSYVSKNETPFMTYSRLFLWNTKGNVFFTQFLSKRHRRAVISLRHRSHCHSAY